MKETKTKRLTLDISLSDAKAMKAEAKKRGLLLKSYYINCLLSGHKMEVAK